MSLSADVLADIFRSVPDCPELGWLFDLAARHPAMKVRCAVARHEHLSPEAVRLLANDSCAEIRRQLVSSPALKRHADTPTVLRLVASDPIVAEELAEHLYDFNGCNLSDVEVSLVNHPDPSVRQSLAHNGDVLAKLLADLANDPDIGVRQCARRRLRLG